VQLVHIWTLFHLNTLEIEVADVAQQQQGRADSEPDCPSDVELSDGQQSPSLSDYQPMETDESGSDSNTDDVSLSFMCVRSMN
jgi:hypothetical protein